MSGCWKRKDAPPKVKEVYPDIVRFFNVPFTRDQFKAMATRPDLPETPWSRFQVIMGKGEVDPKARQVIAPAVSAANHRGYCIKAHTAVLKQTG